MIECPPSLPEREAVDIDWQFLPHLPSIPSKPLSMKWLLKCDLGDQLWSYAEVEKGCVTK